MTRPVGRRPVLKLAAGLAAPAILARGARAAGRSINVGTYSGPQGDYVRRNVIPAFEADHKCRVFQTEGVTLGQIAILRTQKADPTYSVMFMDDVGVPIARNEDLIAPLPRDRMPNLAKVMPRFVFGDGYGAAFAISTIAPFFNTDSTKPIASYAELWDKRFAGRYLTPTPKQSQNVALLVVAAGLVTGKPFNEAQYLIDQAWGRMAELKPNVQTVYESNATAAVQVSQGQADIGGPDFSKSILPYKLKGGAVDMCYPREGSFAGVNCVTIVKNGPEPELAAAFADRMLDPAVQKGLAEATYAAPSVSGITLNDATAKLVAYPESRMDEVKLFNIDWAYINPRRGAIVERMNQVFGA